MISFTHFHSPITKQKLSMIRPAPPNIQYSTYEEINNKFKEFSTKTKPNQDVEDIKNYKKVSKNSQISPNTNFRRSSITPNFQKKPTQRFSMKLDYDTLKTSFGEKSDLQQIVKEEYEKNQEAIMHGKINPIVKFFGNTLIGSVFQALMIQCMEEVSSLNPEDSNAMSSKLLTFFKISTIQLKLSKTQEAKRNYIIKCMNLTIDNLLKSWREKIEFQEKMHTQNNKDYDNLKNRNNEEIRDRFPWLTLKTKYISLQKQLKALIIQKLNDYENQMSVIETLNKRQSISKSMVKISHDELKVTLHDVSPPKTSSLINNSAKTEVGDSPKHNYAMIKKIRSQTGFKNFSIDTRISTSSSTKINQQEKTFPNFQIDKFLEKETQKGSFSIIEDKEIEWDDDFENKFKSYMSQGRKLFFNEMRNAKFYEVGVMHMIQELFKEEKKNLERADCMERYGDGGYLTAEELKFLADTSDLLNSCVDKTYIKKVVTLIDPNILHYIELNLAESIISKYKEMREIIVNARNKFIKKNNDVLKQKLNDYDAKKRKNQETIQQAKNRHRFSKSIRSVVKKVQEKQEKFDEIFHDSLINQINTPMEEFDLNKKFKEFNNLKPYKKSNQARVKNYSQPKEIDIYSNPTHPNVVRHKYHPSSKVFFISTENNENNSKYISYINNDIEKFKLQIKTPSSLKEKDNFIKFYSGGPTQTSDEKYINDLTTPTNFEIKAIIRLQRSVRGYIARKKFSALLAQIQQKNFSLFQEKIKKIKLKSPKSSHVKITAFLPVSPILNKASSRISEKMENQTEARELKIINKSPPKNLLLKHRKLLEATKTNNIYMARNSGFSYYPNDMNVKDKKGNVPLYYASKNENLDFCSYLIELGAKVNERCEDGNTPFHIAFSTNTLEIIMLMLDNGGDLNNTNDFGQTPLAFASHSTLKKLDLENGIATTTNSSIHTFDNNKCLSSKKPKDLFRTNEFCHFQLDKMIDPSDKVRLVDQQHMIHLISFNEKAEINKIKVEENVPSAILSPERQQTGSPLKKKRY